MTPFAALPNPPAAGQIALAVLLAAAGFALLLPRPRSRSVAGGTAALVAAAAVFGAFLHQTFGTPMPDLVGTGLFCLFSAGALGFGAVLVVQRNPARGAIAFAFVILSTCGLFLLLAAPFLMAATIIIYAGAVIVTFLFVLMLSLTDGPSDENDRTREPLLGSLAGFAFVGLVLFTLYQSRAAAPADAAEAARAAPLPAPVVTVEERTALDAVAERLRTFEADEFYTDPAAAGTTRRERMELLTGVEQSLEDTGGSINARLAPYRSDQQAKGVLERTAAVRDLSRAAFEKIEATINDPARSKPAEAKADAAKLREEVRLLRGAGELPARNVGNLGLLLYADHLLAVELAGTLLLVATIGAVAIVHRKGVPPA
jgi:NADH:ubiquinone oxidoreductase subunit 6 (subunit J)